MDPLCQIALLTVSPTAKTVALVLLVAFFIVAIAVVPLEFGFYRSLQDQPFGTAVALEIIISVDIVLMLAGVVLDWYMTPRGMILLLSLMVILLVLTIWFVYWRFRLITALYSRASLRSQEELRRLLNDIAEARKQAGQAPGDGGEDGGATEEPAKKQDDD
ncbi:hypothetical protein J7J84_07415 [bacterium]|nr:hypothetical protein [bacterium]